jgi:uncharacterized OsmC-like protein
MSTTTGTQRFNGFDTELIGGLFAHLESDPEAGRMTMTADARWEDGWNSAISHPYLEVDGQRHDRSALGGRSDEPSFLGGADSAPSPGELLMQALAACLTAATAAAATLGGVRLDSLSVHVDGDVDMHGALPESGVRPGFGTLRARVEIAGDTDEETLSAIVAQGAAISPVRDTIAAGAVVDVVRA